jgi:hypothetical protein
LPIPHKESRNGVLNRENLPVPFCRSPPEFMSPSSTPTTPAFVEQPISLRVSVRSQRPLICAISSTVAYDSRSRRSCSAAGMFAGDAPVTHSKIQHHYVVQRVEGSP